MTAGSDPWEVDRPLSLEAARAAIAASFPGIDVRGLVHLGSGWEFDAFLTGDGRVFRFPRRAECGDLFESERRTLELVTRFLPRGVAVPAVELVSGPTPEFPYPIAGHRFIAGAAADEVDAELLPTLVCDLGATRLGICSEPRCENVFVDTSPNQSRRYCSDRCSSRANVAAFRARQKAAAQ